MFEAANRDRRVKLPIDPTKQIEIEFGGNALLIRVCRNKQLRFLNQVDAND